jgi:excisionase family DNA binding protein
VQNRDEPGAGGMKNGPRFYTVAEAAAVLRTCDMTVYRAIQAGEFPAIKVRGRYVIPARAIDEIEDAALSSGAVVNVAGWAEGGVRDARA